MCGMRTDWDCCRGCVLSYRCCRECGFVRTRDAEFRMRKLRMLALHAAPPTWRCFCGTIRNKRNAKRQPPYTFSNEVPLTPIVAGGAQEATPGSRREDSTTAQNGTTGRGTKSTAEAPKLASSSATAAAGFTEKEETGVVTC